MSMTAWMILLAGISLMPGVTLGKENAMNASSGKNVVMIIAFRDFRDEEFAKPAAALKQAGATITVASSHRGTAEGALGQRVPVDILIGELVVSNFDGIVFVGGPGSQEYFKNPTAHQIAKEAVAQGKVLGAICIAPATLAEAGVLDGKHATSFPSVQPTLKKAGALVESRGVVRDGKLVTADGPASAAAFGGKLVEVLKE